MLDVAIQTAVICYVDHNWVRKSNDSICKTYRTLFSLTVHKASLTEIFSPIYEVLVKLIGLRKKARRKEIY